MEGGEGLFIDVEDISQLLTDVARFADALENLRDVVLRDGGCRGGAGSGQRGWGTADPPTKPPPPAQPHGSALPRGTGLWGAGDEGSNGDRSTPSPGAEPDPWVGGSALSGRGPGPPGAAQSPRAAGGGWLPGARSQDNAASCLRAIFIRPLSCLHSSGASCLPGPPAPVGHRARPRTPGPASLGQPSGWGRCPGAGAGLGGLRGRGLGASGLPGGEGSSSDLVFPAMRWGCRGSHGALFSALPLQNPLTHPHLSWKTRHCLAPAAGAQRTRGPAQPLWAMPPGPAKPWALQGREEVAPSSPAATPLPVPLGVSDHQHPQFAPGRAVPLAQPGRGRPRGGTGGEAGAGAQGRPQGHGVGT